MQEKHYICLISFIKISYWIFLCEFSQSAPYLLYTFISSSPKNCSRSPTVHASIQKRWAPCFPRSFRSCLMTKQSAQYISCSSSISFITVTLSIKNIRPLHVQISCLSIMKSTLCSSNYFVHPNLTKIVSIIWRLSNSPIAVQ